VRRANIHHGAPPNHITAMKIRPSVTVVPRSGSSMISATMITKTGRTGISRARIERSVFRLAARTCPIQISIASLPISLGWKLIGPSMIQLLAPLIGRLTNTTASISRDIATNRNE